MTQALLFRPEVADDACAAFSWYERRGEGLGAEFLRALYVALENVARNPLVYMIVRRPFRRCILRRFPYAVYFIHNRHEVVVFGVFHCARNPATLGRELRGRKRKESTGGQQ